MSATTVTRLDPPIPMRTPLGDAHAFLVIDRGMGTHLEWVCALDVGGTWWTLANPQVRRQSSITEGWTEIEPWRQIDRDTFHWSPEFKDEAKPQAE